MKINRFFSLILLLLSPALFAHAKKLIVPLSNGDATASIQKAIDSASRYQKENTVIQFMPGTYNISRTHSSVTTYHISNTSSFEENPEPLKHIGLWLKNLKNVTIDGNGAVLLTHGEMTSFVIDSCENITLKNFVIAAADPSVVEIDILDVDNNGFNFKIIPPSEFMIDEGLFYFKGDGWIFGDGGKLTNLPQYAQVFYPDRNVTLRCDYPLKDYKKVERIGENTLRMEFDKVPSVKSGERYQLRHGIRNEACGFINMSKDIKLENIDFNFLGNFGIVGQFTENITYDNIRCKPAEDSGRSNAGFADFVQMSGCRGKLIIKNSIFEGAQDDPINIHGTHLKVVENSSPDRLTLRFMHGQTYGFTPFFKGDEIAVIDRHSLIPVALSTVESVRKLDDYNFEIGLTSPLPQLPEGLSFDNYAVENITWTPEVEITNNYFARTPTRGILLTTCRKSLIAGNTFFRIPMASILVSDDARSWYESGAVKDLTIRDNTFIECSEPVIRILPEIDRFDRPVHENILIEGNKIIGSSGNFIEIKAADNIILRNNHFE